MSQMTTLILPQRKLWRWYYIETKQVLLTFDELPADDVVLLQQDMFTPVEADLVLVALVVEPVKAGMPQTCTP